MHAPTPEFLLTYRAMMLDGLHEKSTKPRKCWPPFQTPRAITAPIRTARTAWDLAWHIANCDVQFLDGIADLQFNMAAPADKPKSIAEFVDWYDRNITRAADRVRAMSAEQLRLRSNSSESSICRPFSTCSSMNNHSIHHRGELATYLRPMGSKVPQIYGGSYDEPLQRPVASSAA